MLFAAATVFLLQFDGAVAGALLTGLFFEVDVGAHGGQYVHDEADDDGVDAGVEKQGGWDVELADERQTERGVSRGQWRV